MTADASTRDVVSIGFGPAGISLAAAIDDAKDDGTLGIDMDVLFVEKSPTSAWQSNTLLYGTDIQHNYLRDLATPRNPRSHFTFPNYLWTKGRLFDFGLFGGGAVSRVEWSDYVEWVASEVSSPSLHQHEVISAEPAASNGVIPALRLGVRHTGTGAVTHIQARNLIVSTGHVPRIPDIFKPLLGKSVFHAHQFKERMDALQPRNGQSFAVVGSGQNAAEITSYLSTAFPDSEINWIVKNSGPGLLDRGNFSQQNFFPKETDYVYGLDKADRASLFGELRHTNYGAIDPDDSLRLYRRIYEEQVRGIDRIHVVKRTLVHTVEQRDDGYHLHANEVYGDQAARQFKADAVILCTGFVEERFPRVLEPLRPYLVVDDDGDLEVSRRYRVKTVEAFRPGIWLNGVTEWRHGMNNATTFSAMAIKAQEILEEIRDAVLTQRAGRPAEADAAHGR